MIKRILALSLSLFTLAACNSKGIAIIVDPVSEVQADKELSGFEDALRTAQGYRIYHISDVFFTSAFKMDQNRPRKESSVPSDRFYDDFDLNFDYIGKDDDAPYFYYKLSSGRDVDLQSDIFSGRIRPTDTKNGSTRYDKLRAYLTKATEYKIHPEKVAKLYTFNGSGSINESRDAHFDEQRALREHFPQLAKRQNAFEVMSFDAFEPIKPRVMNAVMQPGLSIAIMHSHGDYDTQYLKMQKEDNLTFADFGQYRPAARLVLLDACYNGAFHMEDCIANEYIFQPGACIAAVGGSVNVLQDKWPDEFLGLLSGGFNIGQINQFAPYLEMHVIGDPTFRFADERDAGADMDCLKIRSGRFRGNLLEVLGNSPISIVRHEALCEIIRSAPYKEKLAAVKLAFEDNSEQVRRTAVNCFQLMGDPSLMPYVAKAVTGNNTTPREWSNAVQSLQFFPEKEMKEAVCKALDSLSRQSADTSYFSQVRLLTNSYCGRWKDDIEEMMGGTWPERKVLRYADFFRIYLPPFLLPDVRNYADTCSSPEQRAALREALSWHSLAYTVNN